MYSFVLRLVLNKSILNSSCFINVDDEGQEYAVSYGELNELSNKLARALRKLEKPENSSKSFVAVCMKPSHRLPTVLVAILKAGMAYLPLDAEFPMARMKHVVQEAKPFTVVIEQEGKNDCLFSFFFFLFLPSFSHRTVYHQVSKYLVKELKIIYNVQRIFVSLVFLI